MQWCSTPECDQRSIRYDLATFDGVHSRCIGHVLVDHFGYSERSTDRVETQRRAYGFRHRFLGSGPIKLHASSGKVVRVDVTKKSVCIGHRRSDASLAVAGRSRIRAGTLGSDSDTAECIYVGDGSATSADLDHLDNRDTKR